MRQSVANILQEVAKDYGLTVSALKSHNRSRHITQPRQEAYYRAFVECPHVSYPEIARRIGGRDHTTVYAGVRRHCEKIGISYDEAKAKREQWTGLSFSESVKFYENKMRDACAY